MHIPGFVIQREIGRGGMARVYLAEQTKFGRQVALKIVTADYAKDDQFRKRFVNETRINGQLTHPNIVQVHDVGEHEDFLYLVMEYLPGGDLNRRLDRGLHVQELVSITKDVSQALDYAHGKGFIHRDIKPENILFRDGDSAVLTDFGIARIASMDPSLTNVGTVVGTPQYMSPEQASGKQLDGRSDLYSLGVVFYRMLTGEVPYQADSAVAVGIKHLQEPIPKLPTYLAAFQPIIDQSLAKDRIDRFQTGSTFADALDAIEKNTQLPNATVRSQAVSTQEIHAITGSMLTTDLDHTRTVRKVRQRSKTGQWVNKFGLAILVAAIVVGGTWIFTQRPAWVDNITKIVSGEEADEIASAWKNAQSLRQDPNQSLATIVAGYERVLKLNPNHEEAGFAIDGLASQWKTDIETALQNDNLTSAETKLNESLAAFPDDSDLAIFSTELENRKQAENLLASTQALLRSHGTADIPSATAAIQAYQEVLRLAPGNETAIKELNDLAQRYAELARTAITEGEVDDAISFLDRASAANAQLPIVAEVRDQIGEIKSVNNTINELLQSASEYRSTNALVDPPGENAAELYHRVLATDPGNNIAAQGLSEVESQFASNANALLTAGDFASARTLVDRATAVGIDSDVVSSIRSRLTTETSRVANVDSYLKRAGDLLRDGFLTEPADDNAVALLREVERLDPGNLQAGRLLAQAAGRLAAVAQDAYESGLSQQAIHYLDLAMTVTPNVPAWRTLREKWTTAIANPNSAPTGGPEISSELSSSVTNDE